MCAGGSVIGEVHACTKEGMACKPLQQSNMLHHVLHQWELKVSIIKLNVQDVAWVTMWVTHLSIPPHRL